MTNADRFLGIELLIRGLVRATQLRIAASPEKTPAVAGAQNPNWSDGLENISLQFSLASSSDTTISVAMEIFAATLRLMIFESLPDESRYVAKERVKSLTGVICLLLSKWAQQRVNKEWGTYYAYKGLDMYLVERLPDVNAMVEQIAQLVAEVEAEAAEAVKRAEEEAALTKSFAAIAELAPGIDAAPEVSPPPLSLEDF